MSLEAPVPIAGVDGCRSGWVCAFRLPGRAAAIRVHSSFEELLAALPVDAIVAIDMPIGLPGFTHRGGRGPEAVVRPLLGQRQSSVFSIPSRAAVYATTRPFTTVEAWYQDHREASRAARETSDPPRGVSIQAFALFPKIRDIDAQLHEHPDLRTRVFESHPELAFWRLNGERSMALPKKIRNVPNPAGIAERRGLLVRCGLEESLLDVRVGGAGADDVLDAAAMLMIAARIARGEALPYPDPPLFDELGLRIAIHA